MDYATAAKAVFDIAKSPTKFFVLGGIVSGVLLFFPKVLLQRIYLDSIAASYGEVVGMSFVVCCGLVVVNFAIWILGAVRRWWRWRNGEAKRISSIRRAMEGLDPQEKAVLREFWLQDAKTIRLPVTHPTVAGLISKSVLTQIGSLGEQSAVGLLWPTAIGEIAEAFIAPETIDLPLSPTGEDMRWALTNRPDYAERIEHRDRSMNGLL
jgi:hypothetical protein